MTPEELALRHDSDAAFLRTVGQALEAESARLREAGEDPLTPASAAAFVAALPQA